MTTETILHLLGWEGAVWQYDIICQVWSGLSVDVPLAFSVLVAAASQWNDSQTALLGAFISFPTVKSSIMNPILIDIQPYK